MRNRTPVPRDARPPLPAFTPVPRKYGHDGWTPERQKAFIEALADCGSVTRRPMAQINMAQANCYTLRRAPEGRRRAHGECEHWDHSSLAEPRLKDIALGAGPPCRTTERAIDGQLHPVFRGGKRTTVVEGLK